MKTVRMTAGDYYITDCCMAYDNYYDHFLMSRVDEWYEEGNKIGSCAIRSTGSDGGGYVWDMQNNIVGSWGSDAANVSVIPAKIVKESMRPHYGTKVSFDEDFDVVFYHDSIVVGNKYRVRHWSLNS